MSTLFSIILPVYNGEKTIERTIQGVLEQTYTNWELIIMDSESTDSSQLIIENYLLDPRIKYFREKDNGIYDGMNKGINKAQGEWLYFTGSDDYFYNDNTLTNISIETTKKKRIRMIYGNVLIKKNTKFGGYFNFNRLTKTNLPHQGAFYSKEIFEKLGLYNIKYKIAADHLINLSVFTNFKRNQIIFIDEYIAFFGDTGLSSKSKDHLFDIDKIDITENFRKQLSLRKKLFLFYEEVRYGK